ncbi:MAG: carboxypeptidase regulatory-like domain-containing protein [Anaerolineae bacterium]
MKSKKLVLALVMATLLVLPVVSAFAQGIGDPDTTVKVTDASFECGVTGTSQILASIVNDPYAPRLVHGVEVHLSFDATKLQVVDADGDPANGVQIAAEGGLFPLAEQVVVQEVDNAAGTILFAVSRRDATSVQDATDAAIATITWAAAVDCATVTQEDCSTVSVVDALMSDADGYAITVDTRLPGTVCYNGEELGCITGTVQLQGRYDHSGATVTAEKDGVVVASAITEPDGSFRLENLAPDTYEVYAEMYGYLDALKASGVQVVAGEECVDTGATKLLGGDVAPQDPEPDNAIDIGDITYIAFRFLGGDMTADVNSDSVVNILDLTMAAANFGRIGPTPWSMTP